MARTRNASSETRRLRCYERPQLRRREKLSAVAEGAPPPVTDGASPKGGCFRRSKP